METVKNRPLPIEGQKVKVYVNLNRKGYFSVVDMKTNLVVAYAKNITLKDSIFHVGQSGREKTVKENCRRVHAWIKGTFVFAETDQPTTLQKEVNYNPFLHKDFISEDTKEPVLKADVIFCSNKRVYI